MAIDSKKLFIKYTKQTGFENTLSIERDYLLNIILFEISKISFSDLLVFKWWTALKKIFFNNKIDDYRFSKDLDFTVIKDVSLNTLDNFIDELIINLDKNQWLKFERLWKMGDWEYWKWSYVQKIKLRDKGQIFFNNIKIKFDFALRPWFNKPYKMYNVKNHYKELFDEEINIQSETIEWILLWKFEALFWEYFRTAPKDLFDLVEILNHKMVSDEYAWKLFHQFNPNLDDRKEKIMALWNVFFEDQLWKIPDINKTLKSYEYHLKKYLK